MSSNYVAMNSGPNNGPASRRDPYFVVKDIIQNSVSKLTHDFEQWQQLLETTNTASSTDFTALTKTVKRNIKETRNHLSDLDKTIDIVEANRAKYSSISDGELASRKTFVAEMRMIVEDSRATLKSDATQAKLRRDKAQANKVSRSQNGLQREVERENQYFMASEQEQQTVQIGRQDEMLDDMNESLKRLGVMGNTIQVELEEQHHMLTDLEADMDHTIGHMGQVMKKLDKVLRHKDRGKLCLFLLLTIILAVLMYFLVF